MLPITSAPTPRWQSYLWVLSPNNACNVIVLKRKQSLIHFKLKQCPSVMHLMQTWSGSTVLLAPQRLHPRGAGLFTPFPADISHSLQAGGVGFPRPLWSKGPGLACLLKCSVTYRWSTAMCQKLAVDRNQGRQNWALSFLPMEGKVDRTRGNGFKWHHEVINWILRKMS